MKAQGAVAFSSMGATARYQSGLAGNDVLGRRESEPGETCANRSANLT